MRQPLFAGSGTRKGKQGRGQMGKRKSMEKMSKLLNYDTVALPSFESCIVPMLLHLARAGVLAVVRLTG